MKPPLASGGTGAVAKRWDEPTTVFMCRGRWGQGTKYGSGATEHVRGSYHCERNILTSKHAAVTFGSVAPHPAPSFSPQLQEAFGWEPFTQLFAEYQTLSGVPKDNTGKMNLWVKKFSEKVQKNLAPFFEAWGWPVQKEVAASLACLPGWEADPMRGHVHTER